METEKVAPVSNPLVSQSALIQAEVVVRDNNGNVKYAGPLILTPLAVELER